VIGNGDISRRIVFLIGSENVRRVGGGVWGLGCWSIVAKKYSMEIFCMNRKECKLFYIRLFVDILSCILGILLVPSFDNCFLGILSSEIVDFFLKN